ncbi:MAG: NUDIX hydrolase [Rubellimicrobium sp.]|nr:NUDIX hydrolase [Rubellimicrobium sp.]
MTALSPPPADTAADSFIVPRRRQLAALCWRDSAGGGREVLMVTSSSGRWILPKGWPMSGKSDGDAAMTEAWEEAGVIRGKVAPRPLGQFIGAKLTREGDEVPLATRVYAIRVSETADDWPEKARRHRRWLPLSEAAELVTEDGLRDILRTF